MSTVARMGRCRGVPSRHSVMVDRPTGEARLRKARPGSATSRARTILAMRAQNAYQRWMEGGFDATNRARTVVAWLRGIAAVIVILTVVAVVGAVASDDSIAIVVVPYTIGSAVIACAVLMAVASIVELLRVQTEATLFNEDDEADNYET